ncbi:MAG TPA: RNA polymerase sigma factor SigJ [Acidimicrobiales bacterium]|jgi:RNA polymerase sigma-70 factor (ECF subfamily)
MRQASGSKCEVVRQPHIDVGSFVERSGLHVAKGVLEPMTAPFGATPSQPRLDLGAVIDERPRLLNIAYRLLGSLSEAEDAVQEAYARWFAMSQQQRDAIESPGAWLNTVTSRICLNVLSSARSRRETYVGEWIPEPLPRVSERYSTGSGDVTIDPADRITLDESISMALLVVLESMTPAERVSFVLHDVFRFPFAEVADIVGRSPAACRQLATSARRRIHVEKSASTSPTQRAKIVRDFKLAWEAKDIAALVGLLDPGSTANTDGGGLVTAVLEPTNGARQIARGCVTFALQAPGLEILERTVNGQPGLIARRDDLTVAVMAFDVVDDRVQEIWTVLNPEKLRPWRSR